MKEAGFWQRLTALTRKETRQMLRGRNNLIVGIILPVVLILLFGYGLSFDVKEARVAVVTEDASPLVHELLAGLRGSTSIAPTWVRSMNEAIAMIRTGKVEAVLRVPSDFSRQYSAGHGSVQLLLNGVNTNTAGTIESYINGALNRALQVQSDRFGGKARTDGGNVVIVQRLWFNEAGISTWYFVPGLVVLIMTLIGAFLTSLLVAREWERGTLEALFVTPVRPLEIILAKLAPYSVVGAIDLVLCLLATKFLFWVPIRGSLWLVVGTSMLFMIVALMQGLWISAIFRNQFAASQVALLSSFLPAMMLSGFVFDLRNVPVVVQMISQILPATHFMKVIKTLFMAGNYWPDIIRSSVVLVFYFFLLLVATHRKLRKSLE